MECKRDGKGGRKKGAHKDMGKYGKRNKGGMGRSGEKTDLRVHTQKKGIKKGEQKRATEWKSGEYHSQGRTHRKKCESKQRDIYHRRMERRGNVENRLCSIATC